MMKLSALMPSLLGKPISIPVLKQNQANQTVTPPAQADSFERGATTPMTGDSKIRNGNFLVDSNMIRTTPDLLHNMVTISAAEVIRVADSFAENLVDLSKPDASGNVGIDLNNTQLALFKILPALDKAIRLGAKEGNFLLSCNQPALEALFEKLQAHPDLVALFKQNLQTLHNSFTDIEKMRLHFTECSLDHAYSLKLEEPLFRWQADYPLPLGYTLVPLITEGHQEGNYLDLIQTNLTPLAGEANFPRFVEDPVYRREQLKIDDQLYQIAKKGLPEGVVSKGPLRSWQCTV